MSLPPVWARANRSASSLASVPELTKKHTDDAVWHFAKDFIGKGDLCRMQIAGVGVHPVQLICRHRLNARMGVADMRHVVIAVQIGPPPIHQTGGVSSRVKTSPGPHR